MGEWRLGAYELRRRLGEGGMAQVYLARDVRLGREVAVKVLDPKLAERPGFRERFMREARVAAALDHPNIVPLFDFGDAEALYLVMPFVSGGSLQDMLPKAPLPIGEVVTYGSQIADALEYAHQRKVVHRDVKPANMLMHADGRLMLSDFGLAKIVNATQKLAAPRNRPDAGTPEYMAPEQVVGTSDSRSDIYGLGVVLYLLLTGRLPFTGSSSHDVMQAHLYKEPAPLRRYNPHVPAAMEAVVMRAMA
ncbi:MAG TPA: serine/threonine-protein kinase, partial [Ktedonobacterales bacterium]